MLSERYNRPESSGNRLLNPALSSWLQWVGLAQRWYQCMATALVDSELLFRDIWHPLAIVWRLYFLSNNFFIIIPVNSNSQAVNKIKKSLGSNLLPLSWQGNAYINVLPLRVYTLTYASVSIHNIIYQFNINSRKLDGQYRRWIEYLNERC